jgi:Methyltransferase domain
MATIRQVLHRVAARTVKRLGRLVDERNAYQERASALTEERDELKQQLTERQQLVSHLTEERDQLQQQLAERRQLVSHLTEERDQLQQRLIERQQLVSHLTEERDQLQQRLTERLQLVSDFIRVSQLRRPFHAGEGKAYTATLNALPATDALVLLLEDDKPLGPGGTELRAIRDLGAGRFSLWNGVLHFSASDSTDCNDNGRDYQLIVLNRELFREQIVGHFEQDDEAVLRLVAGNARHNNRFFANFFQYYETIIGYLSRNNIRVPKVILEIGSGARPYTGLRFLFEGTERYLANDLYEVQSTFSPIFIDALRSACLAINPVLWLRFDKIFKRDGEVYRASGLEPVGGRSFDAIDDEAEAFEFIHSTSVLEHVQEPERIIRKMADLLRSGAHMWHSIDFRDHRDFNTPLAFLEMTEEEYQPIATENRLRPSDWIDLLNRYGFDIIERQDWTMTPESVRAGHGISEASYRFFDPDATITPFVTNAMRAQFVAPFRNKDLVDLSIICTQILCRKR